MNVISVQGLASHCLHCQIVGIIADTLFSDANIDKNHDIFTLLPENYAFFCRIIPFFPAQGIKISAALRIFAHIIYT